MLFVPLLFVMTCAFGTVFHQSPQKDTVMQRFLISESGVSRRLNIFESFAKSEGEPRDDSRIPTSLGFDPEIIALSENETVNEILEHSLTELTRTIGIMQLVFESLSRMLSIPLHSPSSLSLDLYHKLNLDVHCNQEGHLTVIGLNRVGQFDHSLNLLMIPSTVEKVSMQRCGLTAISAWSDLKGKSLKSLRIYESDRLNLKLNLDGLKGTLDYLPLEHLSVGRNQISDYFGLQKFSSSDPAFHRIGTWMRKSTLNVLRIQTMKGRRKSFSFYRDGTWTLA